MPSCCSDKEDNKKKDDEHTDMHLHSHEHHESSSDGDACHSCSTEPGRWYKDKLFIMTTVTFLVLIASYLVPFLNPVLDAFIEYFNMIWWAIILGFIIGGIIDVLIPQEYITKFLSKKEKKTIFYGTFLGFLMSACSHGILAISIALYRKGASIPAVIAFLMAAPWANLTVTILLFGLFGLKAFFLIGSAIIVAIITGLIFQVLENKGLIEKSKDVKIDENFSIRKDIKRRMRDMRHHHLDVGVRIKDVLKSSWSLTRMVLWWILIGMLLASFARAFVPVEIFQQYLGPTFLGLVVTLIVATIIEVCSEGSTPLAFEIYRQTGAFGNSFIFLMAGVATDYTEIGLIWSNIGKKTAMWLPIVTVPQLIALGWIFNMFL